MSMSRMFNTLGSVSNFNVKNIKLGSKALLLIIIIIIMNHSCYYFLLMKHAMINVSSCHLSFDKWLQDWMNHKHVVS